jgi:probable F420-dependent oxidoreductase
MANASAGGMKIGLVMPIAEDDGPGMTPRYSEIREVAVRSEAAGLDSIWVYDHLLFRSEDKPTTGIWECWSLLAALAEATERVQLGTIVMCVPFRNPAVLAKMADTVDEISGGRLILGLGAGWNKPEFDAFGVPFDHKAARFEEALQIMVPLLREGKVDFTGQYYSAPNCELRPRGPRERGPEILVAAAKPRMLRLAARYADSWNTAWLGLPTLLHERRARLDTACAEEGRDPATLATTVGVIVQPPQLTSHEDLPPERALFGTPEQVAAGMKQYADLGVEHLICTAEQVTPEIVDWLGEVVAIVRQM